MAMALAVAFAMAALAVAEAGPTAFPAEFPTYFPTYWPTVTPRATSGFCKRRFVGDCRGQKVVLERVRNPISFAAVDRPHLGRDMIAIKDWDGDGDLDLIMYGLDTKLSLYLRVDNDTLELATGSNDPFFGLDEGAHRPPNYFADAYYYWGTGVWLDVVDWDADGDLDVFVREPKPHTEIRYFERIGPNEMEEQAVSPVNNSLFGWSCWREMADFDGDGDVDVLSYNCEGTVNYYERVAPDRLEQRLDESNPVHNLPMEYPLVVDFDGDGDLDILSLYKYFPERDSDPVLFERFAPDTLHTSGATLDGVTHSIGTAVAFGDWDGDGTVDMLAYVDREFWLYRQVVQYDLVATEGGDNPFRDLDLAVRGWMTHAIPALGDWDGDGDIDLILGQGTFSGSHFHNLTTNLEYWEQQEGILVPRGLLPNFANAMDDWRMYCIYYYDFDDYDCLLYELTSPRPAMTDWDGDGDMDLVVNVAQYRSPFYGPWLLEQMDPDNMKVARLPARRSCGSVAVGDWDGDGDIDLISHVCQDGDDYEDYGDVPEIALFERVAPNELEFRNTFACIELTCGVVDTSLAMVDWDNDGDMDLLGVSCDNRLLFFERVGAHTVSCDGVELLGDLWEQGSFLQDWIAAVDWDLDGDVDLVRVSDRTVMHYDRGGCRPTAPCTNNGVCDTTGHCSCLAGFATPTCAVCEADHLSSVKLKGHRVCTACPGLGQENGMCSQRGTCVDDAYVKSRPELSSTTQAMMAVGNGTCLCTPPFYGAMCELGICAAGRYEAKADVSNYCEECPLGTFSDPDIGYSECEVCPPGKHAAAPGSSRCLNCTGGSVPEEAQTGCEPCEAGKYAAPGSEFCTPCPAGKYVEARSSSCATCAEGQVPALDQGSCDTCAVGRYAPFGSLFCSPCPQGSIAAANSSSCIECAGGEEAALDQGSCNPCAAGKYAPFGSLFCSPCPQGRIAAANSSSCIECAGGEEAALDQGSCGQCSAGWYAIPGSMCEKCPSGRASAPGSSSCIACGLGQWADSGDASCSLDTFLVMGFCIVAILQFVGWFPGFLVLRRRLRLQDVRSGDGRHVVCSTFFPHRVHPGRYPIMLIDGTAHPGLDGQRGVVQVLDPFRLQVNEVGSGEASMGWLTPRSPRELLYSTVGATGMSPATVCALAHILAVPLTIVLSIEFFRDRDLLVHVGFGLAHLFGVLLALLSAMFFRWRGATASTKLIRRVRRFRRKLLLHNPTPCPSTPGPGRAITMGVLQDLLESFSEFILLRNAYYLNHNITMPITEPWRLSFAELVGPTTLTFFASHHWGSEFRQFVNALFQHAQYAAETMTVEGGWESFSYWVCFLSNNQWKLTEELGDNWSRSSFYKALRHQSCRATCMVLDREAMPLTRSWCLFELLQTYVIRRERQSMFEGLIFCSAEGIIGEHDCFDTALALGKKLATLSLKDATASNKEDESMILRLVEEEEARMETSMDAFIKTNMMDTLRRAKTMYVNKVHSLHRHLEAGQRRMSRANLVPAGLPAPAMRKKCVETF